MMDAYSFDLNAEECAKTYQKIRKAYLEIFEILGLNANQLQQTAEQWVETYQRNSC